MINQSQTSYLRVIHFTPPNAKSSSILGGHIHRCKLQTNNVLNSHAKFFPVEVIIDFVIGIHFGVCFTGVAYSHGSQIKDASSQKRDLDRFAEATRVINTWPHSTQLNQEKTRTVIAYNSNPPDWGRRVNPIMDLNRLFSHCIGETNNAVPSSTMTPVSVISNELILSRITWSGFERLLSTTFFLDISDENG